MNRRVLRSTLGWIVVGALGCATGGGGVAGGCGGCVEPIPGGFPLEQRTNNAITAKVSKDGLRFFEQRVSDIIGMLATNGLAFQVPCIDQSQTFTLPLNFGTINVPLFVCDHTKNDSCAEERNISFTPATADDQKPLVPKLRACQANGSIKTLKITPTQLNDSSPVNVAVKLEVRVNTGGIPLHVGTTLCDIDCQIEYDSDTVVPADIPFTVNLNLKLDPAYGDILGFEVGEINVTDIFDISDLKLERTEGVCSYLCDVIGVDFVKTFIVNFLRPRINLQIKNILDTFRCRACEAVTNNCPLNSHCELAQGVCYSEFKPDTDPSKDKRVCPPALLGMEGRVGVGGLLGGFGAPSNSLLDLYAVAGGRNLDGKPSAQVANGGIVIAVMGGTRSAIRDPNGTVRAPAVSACVPAKTWTERVQPHAINFDTEATAAGAVATGYHFGFALSDNFLDKSMFDAYQAGLLCLNVDSSLSTFLSSSLFRTFLPSLGVLTHGQDVPMVLALRPKEPPSIIIGKGTTKLVNGEEIPDDPLVTINMEKVQIDFYTLIEDREARIFSLTADITLPLSLKFNAATNTVQPILANLSGLVRNVSAQNSEMLAEDPQVVADLLDAVIGLVQPILASVLAPIELPTLNGFKVAIRDARGAVKYTGVQPGYEHLAMFANLEIAAAPLIATVETEATLVDGFVPGLAELRDEHLRPFAVLQVKGGGLRHNDFAGYEYAWRVDRGLWSPFTASERLEVHAPVLLLPGKHDIEVIARERGAGETEDPTPANVTFLVDYEAPSVQLELNPETREVLTVAADAVARIDELSFRYRVAGADWSDSGGAQSFLLDDLGIDPSLEVEVTDPAKHVAIARFGTPAAELGNGSLSRSHDLEAGGCTQAGASALALAGLAVGALGRRRQRRA